MSRQLNCCAKTRRHSSEGWGSVWGRVWVKSKNEQECDMFFLQDTMVDITGDENSFKTSAVVERGRPSALLWLLILSPVSFSTDISCVHLFLAASFHPCFFLFLFILSPGIMSASYYNSDSCSLIPFSGESMVFTRKLSPRCYSFFTGWRSTYYTSSHSTHQKHGQREQRSIRWSWFH